MTATITNKATADRILAAETFVTEWTDRGQENADTQTFWNQFLEEVMGISRVHHHIDYEKKVRIGRSSNRIDAYIPESRILIEQKSYLTDLTKPQHQSDDTTLTPYEQALRYAANLPQSEQPKYIITCNFSEFHIYDRNHDPAGTDPTIITLQELPQQLQAFTFITEPIDTRITRQQQLNFDAARLIGNLYDDIKHQYTGSEPSSDPTDTPTCTQRDLATLMVRLLFCLYSEDSGLFEQGLFRKYLLHIPAGQGHFRRALIDLFRTLNTPYDQRDTLPTETLAQFPYINGGLFADSIEIPIFTNDIKFKLLHEAGENFNWSEISPVIFGSIFESILSGDERRAGGMHYTSVDNIHKVIDPLFLNDLRQRLNKAGTNKTALTKLQTELATLNFLDPACGSGNFLTQTYLELRSIENEILKRLIGDQMTMDLATFTDAEEEGGPSLVKVNVGQFYGIEINDFAVSVANAALWIADHQANQQTAKIIGRPVVNLPLIDYHHIVVGNALRMDWNEVLPASECSYIMGNPPFLGYSNQSPEQKADMLAVCTDENGKPLRGAGKIDYVAGWYFKTARFVGGGGISAALVSTSSITQGEQVVLLWQPLIEEFGMSIDFAYRTFNWTVDHANAAAVHCVIIGFSCANSYLRCPNESHLRHCDPRAAILDSQSRGSRTKIIYDGCEAIVAQNINPYLLDAPNIFIKIRTKPLSDVPKMITGNRPADGGHLIIEDVDLADFIKNDPLSEKYIRKFMGAAEFINNRKRWCLWLVGVPPKELRSMPEVMKRIAACREDRLSAKDIGRQRLAETPTLFREVNSPQSFIIIPRHSSEGRKYIPLGFAGSDVIVNDAVMIIPDATLYHFGVLISQFHNVWVRTVAGRLESRYRYSKNVVYNNFIWPDPTDLTQKAKIEQLAQSVLDARATYSDSSLADLYDPLTMPPDLLKTHKALDKAVEQAYGVNFRGNEPAIVQHLFQLYSRKVREDLE